MKYIPQHATLYSALGPLFSPSSLGLSSCLRGNANTLNVRSSASIPTNRLVCGISFVTSTRIGSYSGPSLSPSFLSFRLFMYQLSTRPYSSIRPLDGNGLWWYADSFYFCLAWRHGNL